MSLVSDRPTFQTAVRTLFVRLGLSDPPRFDATGIVRLRIDGQGVNLSDDGRGHLVMEAIAGPVPEDEARRRAWRAETLRLAPGFLLTQAAGAFLRRQGNATLLVVQGRYRLGANRVELLEAMIEDVLFLSERYGRALPGPGTAPSPTSVAPGAEDFLIFRL